MISYTSSRFLESLLNAVEEKEDFMTIAASAPPAVPQQNGYENLALPTTVIME